MKNTFIELTDNDDQKFLINVKHIIWTEPSKSGTSFRIRDYSFVKKVKESYEDVRSLIKALDS